MRNTVAYARQLASWGVVSHRHDIDRRTSKNEHRHPLQNMKAENSVRTCRRSHVSVLQDSNSHAAIKTLRTYMRITAMMLTLRGLSL
jgi:hypothetical protein